jgi:hypothetical protein
MLLHSPTGSPLATVPRYVAHALGEHLPPWTRSRPGPCTLSAHRAGKMRARGSMPMSYRCAPCRVEETVVLAPAPCPGASSPATCPQYARRGDDDDAERAGGVTDVCSCRPRQAVSHAWVMFRSERFRAASIDSRGRADMMETFPNMSSGRIFAQLLAVGARGLKAFPNVRFETFVAVRRDVDGLGRGL